LVGVMRLVAQVKLFSVRDKPSKIAYQQAAAPMSARTGVVNRPFKQMVAADAAATSLLSLCYLKTSLSFGMAKLGALRKACLFLLDGKL
jgi:hypothetical protein